MPIAASALLSSETIPNATLKIYEGAPHDLPTTHKDRLNQDLLDSSGANRASKHARAGSGAS